MLDELEDGDSSSDAGYQGVGITVMTACGTS
jgi:hypothetical protein